MNADVPPLQLCPECGAALPPGGTCRDLFNDLLGLEAEVLRADPALGGAEGQAAHFYAVSSYLLQHPAGMGLSAAALAGVRANLFRHLDGQATLAEIRVDTRRAVKDGAHVKRRAAEAPPGAVSVRWPVTVADMLAGGAPGYCARTAAWARAVRRTLESGCRPAERGKS